jgi:hypothetical protein
MSGIEISHGASHAQSKTLADASRNTDSEEVSLGAV